MERFNYQSIAALRAESGELMRMLEAEQWGRGMDEEEALAESQSKIESHQQG